MRDSKQCPKCRHNKIVYIPRIELGANHRLTAHFHGRAHSDAVAGDFWCLICQRCGYTETYALHPEQIRVDQIDGAMVVEGPPPPSYSR